MADRVFLRIKEAYINMATEGRYRPFAPGDGLGSTYLTPEEIADPERLDKEAEEFAAAFIKEEKTMQFHIGTSNWRGNRALVYTIQAAKELCGGRDDLVIRLLTMAIEEVKANPPQV